MAWGIKAPCALERGRTAGKNSPARSYLIEARVRCLQAGRFDDLQRGERGTLGRPLASRNAQHVGAKGEMTIAVKRL